MTTRCKSLLGNALAWGFVAVMLCPFLSVGIVGVTRGIYVLSRQAEAREWVVTDGTLLEAEYVRYQPPRVCYQYVADGRNFVGTKFALAEDVLTGMTAKRLINEVRQDAEDGSLTVYVDPRDPSSSVLYAAREEGVFSMIGGLMGIGLAASIILVATWRACRVKQGNGSINQIERP
jgi:hypothetical protein